MTELMTRMQRWLDEQSEAFFANDFAIMFNRTVLPYVIVTRTAVIVVEDEARLREGFHSWVGMLRTQNVSDLIYTVQDANEISDGLISARYTTHLLRDATPICPPYSSTSTYRTGEDGTVRAVSMTTGMKNLSWPITVPRVGSDSDPLE